MKLRHLLTTIIFLPFVLFFALCLSLYIPSVQQWAVDKASAYMSEETGMRVSVGNVRLSFPLDLSMNRVGVLHNNMSADTLLYVDHLLAGVSLMPLVDLNVEINQFELTGVKVNTLDVVPTMEVRGSVGRLLVSNIEKRTDVNPVANILLNEENAEIGDVLIDQANLAINLKDTTVQDTSETSAKWKIAVRRLRICHSSLVLNNSTNRTTISLNDFSANNIFADLGKQHYALRSLNLNGGFVENATDTTQLFTDIKPNETLRVEAIKAQIDSVEANMSAPRLKALVRNLGFALPGKTRGSLKGKMLIDETMIFTEAKLTTPSSYVSALISAKGVEMNKLLSSADSVSQTSPAKTAFDKSQISSTINTFVSSQDMRLLLSCVGMQEYASRWPDKPLEMQIKARGSKDRITIDNLSIEVPTMLKAEAEGTANGWHELMEKMLQDGTQAMPLQEKMRLLDAHLKLKASTYNATPLIRMIDNSLSMPRADIAAGVDILKGLLKADANINVAKSGTVKTSGWFNMETIKYDMNLDMKNIDVKTFMPSAPVGLIALNMNANGKGFDLKSPSCKMNASIDIDSVVTTSAGTISRASAQVTVDHGRALAHLSADSKRLKGDVNIDILLNPHQLDATIMTELEKADLYAMGIAQRPFSLSVCSHIDVRSDYKNTHWLLGNVNDILIVDSVKTYHPDDIAIHVNATPDTTAMSMYCGDFMLDLGASGSYQGLQASAMNIIKEIESQKQNRRMARQELRNMLPQMSLKLRSSKSNPIYRFIKYYDCDYDDINVNIKTSSLTGINGDVQINGLSTAGYQLDSIMLNVRSNDLTGLIEYDAKVRNVKPNPHVFDVQLTGELQEHGLTLNSLFRDAKGAKGLEMSLMASMVAEGIQVQINSEKEAIIGYRPFAVNEDNFLLFGHEGRTKANIDLIEKVIASASNSAQRASNMGVHLYSTDNEQTADCLQDITLSLSNLNLAQVLSVIPYAPAMRGMMDADIHFVQEADKTFSVSSSIATNNLVYENCPIGNLGTELVYMPRTDGAHYVDGILTLSGEEIGNVQGSCHLETGEMSCNLHLQHFPLSISNGFFPDKIIGLEGYADGDLTMGGTMGVPIVDGELYLESASLVSQPYGVKLRFDNDPIRIESSRLLFENFQAYASNDQPLAARGYIDFSNLEQMTANIVMRAENFQLINSKETRTSEVYGKAFVDFLAQINGPVNNLNVLGKIDILPTTNIYYVLRESPLSSSNKLKELVEFTNPNAAEETTSLPPTPGGMKINMNINVKDGAHIKCWLNDARDNYLDIDGGGELKWRFEGDEMAMTGRYTITEGELKYSLPIIPLKTFKIASGSYLEFMGDLMNPRLNITAHETKRAAVTIDNNERMVTFQTGVKLSKTLNDMGLEFVINAPEDGDISGELDMMSQEDRNKVAVTMLTTGMYFADGNTSSFSMNAALNAFLQSEISNLAGSALKTLDMSFGMDNSLESDGTKHTNYNFKFARRFWDNRLAVSVGGKISTGADVSGQNNTFFDNVEVQYRLSETSNKYVNAFYNRSVYDYLEGYVGQYGGGFMWKKKFQSLKDFFKP